MASLPVMRIGFAWTVLLLTVSFAAGAAVEPVPESQQAAMAEKIIEAWRAGRASGPPKRLHVVYYTPSDRQPESDYRVRLEAILEDIRAFYRDGMERSGFGPKTFELDRDAEGRWAPLLVKGKLPESSFTASAGRSGTGSADAGEKVREECRAPLEAAGISYDQETVLIFCNLAHWDPKGGVFSHHSPYFGTWNQTSGLCFAADSVILNVADIPKKEPMLDDQEYGKMSLGKFETIFIGGIAHELGHAFSLPHCGARWDQADLGTSIMGSGNHTYREERRNRGKGSFLAMASAMKLASRPLFSKCDLDMSVEPRLETNFFEVSTNVSSPRLMGRKGALRVEGTVRGTPPVYAVIAYFDSARDGGYFAPTATAVPDNEGRFALELSDVAPTENGQLRLQYCHANGAVSEMQAYFAVRRDGRVDLSQGEMRSALEPVGAAVAANDIRQAQAALEKLEASAAPEAAKAIARKAVATLGRAAKPSPASALDSVTRLPLGDAQAETAEVGWLQPAANRLPPNGEVAAPFLDSGHIYATGLFAHSPSRYVFDVGGKWKRLRGEAGLDSTHQDSAAGVVFVIRADGNEVYRSTPIRGVRKASYDVSLAGVRKLVLVVEKATPSNTCNWALWLDPILER